MYSLENALKEAAAKKADVLKGDACLSCAASVVSRCELLAIADIEMKRLRGEISTAHAEVRLSRAPRA